MSTAFDQLVGTTREDVVVVTLPSTLSGSNLPARVPSVIRVN